MDTTSCAVHTAFRTALLLGGATKAAELAVLEQVRQLGRQALGEWAQQQADRKAEELPQLNPSACRDKKNSPLA